MPLPCDATLDQEASIDLEHIYVGRGVSPINQCLLREHLNPIVRFENCDRFDNSEMKKREGIKVNRNQAREMKLFFANTETKDFLQRIISSGRLA